MNIAMSNELRRWIRLVESSDLDTHIHSWVSGNPSAQAREIMSDLASHSVTKAPALFRVHHDDPDYTNGQIIDLPALSFTSNNPHDNKYSGASEWRSKHKSIFHIPNPKKGFDIPYIKSYGFSAGDEKETVVSGRYRIIKKDMVPEPHTNSNHYKVPQYTLSDA